MCGDSNLRIDSVDRFAGSKVSAEASVTLEKEGITSGGALDDLGQVLETV
jgi:hypothetical protein